MFHKIFWQGVGRIFSVRYWVFANNCILQDSSPVIRWVSADSLHNVFFFFYPPGWSWQWKKLSHTSSVSMKKRSPLPPNTRGRWWILGRRLRRSSPRWPAPCRNTWGPPDSRPSTAWRASSHTCSSASHTTWHPRWGDQRDDQIILQNTSPVNVP